MKLSYLKELLDLAQNFGGGDHIDFDVMIWNPKTEFDEDIIDVKWAHDLRKDLENQDGIIRLITNRA